MDLQSVCLSGGNIGCVAILDMLNVCISGLVRLDAQSFQPPIGAVVALSSLTIIAIVQRHPGIGRTQSPCDGASGSE